jgi:hypothetical protein
LEFTESSVADGRAYGLSGDILDFFFETPDDAYLLSGIMWNIDDVEVVFSDDRTTIAYFLVADGISSMEFESVEPYNRLIVWEDEVSQDFSSSGTGEPVLGQWVQVGGPGPISIDIMPNNDNNIVSIKSKGSVKVAVLSTEDFLAYNEVDTETVRFGPDQASPTRYKVLDVNSDGLADILFYFSFQATGIECGQTEAVLVGQLVDETGFEASDTVLVKGCR